MFFETNLHTTIGTVISVVSFTSQCPFWSLKCLILFYPGQRILISLQWFRDIWWVTYCQQRQYIQQETDADCSIRVYTIVDRICLFPGFLKSANFFLSWDTRISLWSFFIFKKIFYSNQYLSKFLICLSFLLQTVAVNLLWPLLLCVRCPLVEKLLHIITLLYFKCWAYSCTPYRSVVLLASRPLDDEILIQIFAMLHYYVHIIKMYYVYKLNILYNT